MSTKIRIILEAEILDGSDLVLGSRDSGIAAEMAADIRHHMWDDAVNGRVVEVKARGIVIVEPFGDGNDHRIRLVGLPEITR